MVRALSDILLSHEQRLDHLRHVSIMRLDELDVLLLVSEAHVHQLLCLLQQVLPKHMDLHMQLLSEFISFR